MLDALGGQPLRHDRDVRRVQSKAAHPAEVPRGTKLSESQLISATQGHLIKRHSAEPTGIQASHNPEVAGSNPPPLFEFEIHGQRSADVEPGVGQHYEVVAYAPRGLTIGSAS